jgi:hypothetical protein
MDADTTHTEMVNIGYAFGPATWPQDADILLRDPMMKFRMIYKIWHITCI